MQCTYYYNGFDYVRNGSIYQIVGLPIKFKTLDALKRHIDFMKLDKPTKTTAFYIP